MIAKLITALLKLIGKVASLLLLPLDLVVNNLLPDVSHAVYNITQYLNLPAQYMGWIFQLFNVPTLALTLIIAYWVFKYAVTGAVAGTKKVITLYQRFKI